MHAPRRVGALAIVAFVSALGGCCAEPPAPAPVRQEAPSTAAVASTSPGTPPRAIQTLNATLWLQQSAEAQALTRQAYALARLRLDEALADPTWTAAEEQPDDFAGLPPAVIVDVDETLLDNSYYQARAILAGEEFDQAAWTAWCEEAVAPAIAGAKEFCLQASQRGVTVFYVTNRIEVEKEATRRNLAALGFPLAEGADVLLCKQGKSDKGPRRRAIAERYRVLLLIGDSATDFSSAFGRQDNPTRARIAAEAAAMWGTRWIVLPNPMYGSWADNVVERDPVEDRLKVLRTRP